MSGLCTRKTRSLVGRERLESGVRPCRALKAQNKTSSVEDVVEYRILACITASSTLLLRPVAGTCRHPPRGRPPRLAAHLNWSFSQ